MAGARVARGEPGCSPWLVAIHVTAGADCSPPVTSRVERLYALGRVAPPATPASPPRRRPAPPPRHPDLRPDCPAGLPGTRTGHGLCNAHASGRPGPDLRVPGEPRR